MISYRVHYIKHFSYFFFSSFNFVIDPWIHVAKSHNRHIFNGDGDKQINICVSRALYHSLTLTHTHIQCVFFFIHRFILCGLFSFLLFLLTISMNSCDTLISIWNEHEKKKTKKNTNVFQLYTRFLHRLCFFFIWDYLQQWFLFVACKHFPLTLILFPLNVFNNACLVWHCDFPSWFYSKEWNQTTCTIYEEQNFLFRT